MATSFAPVNDAIDRIEQAGPLDPPVKLVRGALQKALGPQPVKDFLHGVWLGHPLHPVLTDVPIGMWSAAALLDLLPGNRGASTTLVAAGCASAVPTAVTGWADWTELNKPHQRVGLVHALANTAALGIYTASLGARLRGRHTRARMLGFAGLGMVLAGGYLGGHLVFRQAAGANHTADTPDLFPQGWHDVGPVEELPEGRPTKRSVENVNLCVVRRGQHVDVLSDTCSHLGGPLSEGEFTSESGQGAVACPWHGSTFRLSDGQVVHGPATSPQQVFETRVSDGRLEVRLSG